MEILNYPDNPRKTNECRPVNEKLKRYYALHNENIFNVLKIKSCQRTYSNIASSSTFRCNGNCLNNLGLISDAVKAIEDIRRMLWIDALLVNNIGGPGGILFSSRSTGRDIRNCLIINYLFTNLNETSSGRKKNSFIMGNNSEVCRYFFRVASGIKERKLNSAYNYVLTYHHSTPY
jgi:hypothetical protein